MHSYWQKLATCYHRVCESRLEENNPKYDSLNANVVSEIYDKKGNRTKRQWQIRNVEPQNLKNVCEEAITRLRRNSCPFVRTVDSRQFYPIACVQVVGIIKVDAS